MGFLKDNKIKAVCFDIDGTLYDIKQMNAYLVKTFFLHPIFSLKYNSMRQKMRKVDGLEKKTILSPSEFRRKEYDLMYKSFSEENFESYKKKLENYFFKHWNKSIEKLKPYKNMEESIKALKDNGYTVAVLSDFPLSNKLESLGIKNLVDYAASSEDFGYLKPNSTVFLEIAKKLNLEPKEILFVGDSFDKDVKGANNVGMKSMLINKKENEENKVADLRLSSFDSFIKSVL